MDRPRPRRIALKSTPIQGLGLIRLNLKYSLSRSTIIPRAKTINFNSLTKIEGNVLPVKISEFNGLRKISTVINHLRINKRDASVSLMKMKIHKHIIASCS